MAARQLLAQILFALLLTSTPASRVLRKRAGSTAAAASTAALRARRDVDEDADGGDEFEYGGKETEVTQSNAGDFSAHQFLVTDDARDGPASTDNAKEELARQSAEAADDHFNSEDTPDPDAFVQLKNKNKQAKKARSQRQPEDDADGGDEFEYGGKETEVSQSNAADFSAHQFLVTDDARDGPASTDNAKEELARQSAEAADDHFNSEDTPDPDAFVQLDKSKRARKQRQPEDDSDDEYEHGSKETEVTQSNSADFSVHQFLVNDDARDGPSASADSPQEELARQRAEAADDHFNSEDTPDPNA